MEGARGRPRRRGALARAVTGAIVAAIMAPLCDCRPPDKNGAFGELAAKDAVGCCTEFRVGYDMLVTDFGVDGSVRASYGAFAQAMGDYVALSSRMLGEVAGACRNLALDFGGSADDAAVKGRSGTEASFAWCNLASRRLADAFTDSLQPAGRFTPHFSAEECWVDDSIVARCEAACSGDASCEERPAAQRCDKDYVVGTCMGKCTGTCDGSAAVPASCDGTCDAECEGSCSGSCYGTCEGTPQIGGRCRGVCMGTCAGTCHGACTGICHYGKAAKGVCDGSCKGGCSVPYATSRCSADLAAPKCPVDGACEANCRAIGQARATCSAPSLTLALGDDISRDIAADLGIETKLRALETNLPALMNAADGRGPALAAEAKAAYEAGEAIVVDKDKGALGKLGLRGSACALVMQAAGEQAIADFQTAGEAARAVLKTLPTPR